MSRELETCPNVVFCLFVCLFFCLFFIWFNAKQSMHKEYVCM